MITKILNIIKGLHNTGKYRHFLIVILLTKVQLDVIMYDNFFSRISMENQSQMINYVGFKTHAYSHNVMNRELPNYSSTTNPLNQSTYILKASIESINTYSEILTLCATIN